MTQVPAVRPVVAKVSGRPGSAWSRWLEPFFQRIRVDQEAVERLEDAHQKGIVVHVFRAHRVLDPLFVLYALAKLGLPSPRWLHDHFASSVPAGAEDLVQTLAAGEPALLFLRRPRTLINPNTAYSEKHVEALLALQRRIDKPIYLLPETLLWTKQKSGLRRTIIDAIFGDRENPGRMREVLGFFWHHKSSRYHVGAPIDLRAVLAREVGTPDSVIAKKIRWALLHHLSREEELRTGPVGRSAARTRQNVLKDPTLKKQLPLLKKPGEELADVERRADQVLRTIAADMRYGWLRVLDAVIDYIWSRIYDGIVVDQEGLARLQRAARRGPVVLVPSHKSHVDYLVLSQVFFKDGLMPPHIAAGDNLNFWPLGHIFRRSGAFFLRRGFKGDRLYALVFAAYVRRLLKEGHALEFFIEGGRSRTGKMLPARTGLLSMCVDPVLEGSVQDLSFIPVSIGYEKIIEAGTYAKELSGGEKKKEDAGALLSATSVLRSKYGRVYVDFAEPISLRVFAASRGIELKGPGDPEAEPGPEKKQLVTQLGHRIVNGINQVTRVTPTAIAALVLLAQPRRGLAEAELHRLADRSLEFLTPLGVRLSAALSPETRKAALREALGRFAAEGNLAMIPAPDGETIYQVNDEGRRALDYYKNNILHFYVPYAVAAAAVLVRGGEPEATQETARRISQLLKFEFSFRVDQAFEDNYQQALEVLAAQRILAQVEGRFIPTKNGAQDARNLAGLLLVFFEAYRLAAETLEELEGGTLPQKRFLSLALARARRQILEGRIQRAEAGSQLTLQASLQLLGDLGVTKKSGDVEVADEAARKALIEELSGYLKAISRED